MRLVYTKRFLKSYAEAPDVIKRAVDRRLVFLLQDLRHPSLQAKKYDEARDLWQARVNGGWRFYFRIDADAYHLIDLIPHPK
jgi:plasmid maintenance system killer protein